MMKTAWLNFSGQAYSLRISQSTELWIFRESDGNFSVWRFMWNASNKPYREILMDTKPTLEKAQHVAKEYLAYVERTFKHRKEANAS